MEHPLIAWSLSTLLTALDSASSGRVRARPSHVLVVDGSLIRLGSSACTVIGRRFLAASLIIARTSSSLSTARGEKGCGMYSFKEKAPDLTIAFNLSGVPTAATWNPTLTRILPEADSIRSLKRSAESTTGCEFGMSRRLVKPPAAPAEVPVVKSSL